MRPPQFAGESYLARDSVGEEFGASMRPPQFAGESSITLDSVLRGLVLQ